LPIVATRVGGVPDIVHEAENGFLIDPARPDQLIQAILRLRSAPELRRTLGERGFELAKNFTASIMCEKYVELYRGCLSLDPVQGNA